MSRNYKGTRNPPLKTLATKKPKRDLLNEARKYIRDLTKETNQRRERAYRINHEYNEKDNILDVEQMRKRMHTSSSKLKTVLNKLYEEDFLYRSGEGSWENFFLNNIIDPREEGLSYVQVMDLKKCPICNSRLIINTSEYKALEYTALIKTCKNSCYIHRYFHTGEVFYIFEKAYHFSINLHKTERERTINALKHEIAYWCKNDRYIARMLVGANAWNTEG